MSEVYIYDSSTKSLRQKATMKIPEWNIDPIYANNYDRHISQLKRYPAPSGFVEDGRELREGVDFKLVPDLELQTAIKLEIEEMARTKSTLVGHVSDEPNLIAVPIPKPPAYTNYPKEEAQVEEQGTEKPRDWNKFWNSDYPDEANRLICDLRDKIDRMRINYADKNNKAIEIIEGYKEGTDLQEVLNQVYYTLK